MSCLKSKKTNNVPDNKEKRQDIKRLGIINLFPGREHNRGIRPD